jgi:hypothetical protein
MTSRPRMWSFRFLAASASGALVLIAADAACAGGRTVGRGIVTNSAGSKPGPVNTKPGGGAGKGIVTNSVGSKPCPNRWAEECRAR